MRTDVYVVTVFLAILLVSCNGADESADGASAAGDDRAGQSSSAPAGRPGGGPPAGRPGNGRPMETAVASLGARSRVIQVGGRLRPRTRIEHQVPVAGLVREIAVSTGDRVRSGSVLFTVERDEIGQTFRPVPVEARISGVVSDVDIQVEEQVGVGTVGVAIVGDDGYVMEAQVSDRDASNLQVGTEVTAHATDGMALRGTLTGRAAEPDYETGLFAVTFSFSVDQPVGIGSFLVVDLPTRQVEGIFVDRTSVDRRYGRYFLWVVDEEVQVLTRREVSLGEIVGDEVVIVSGIEPGERYVAQLTGDEREGAPVPAMEDGPDSSPAASERTTDGPGSDR